MQRIHDIYRPTDERKCDWREVERMLSDEELKGWLAEAGFSPGDTFHAPPPMPHWLVSATRN